MDSKLEGKRALITGSSAGIGYAIAERLALEGASVIVNGRTQNAATGLRGRCANVAGKQL
jgi:NAD(P)-dependent dehydrogenase (short-subunit alcohol dehydrogenase family)